MEYHYYILRNVTSTNKQSLKTGVIITKIPSHLPFGFNDGDGPYKSLRAIKKYSPIYQSLKKTNLRRAQQIVLEKNISTLAKIIATPRGMEFKQEIVDAFIHITIGRIKGGDVTGIHFYDTEKVKLLKVLETDSVTGIFKAQIEFLNIKTKEWITKKSPSTFFPKNWNLTTLLMECKYAFDRIDNGNLKNGKIKSQTKSKIEVEFVFKDGKLKSLYPLI